MTYGRRGETLRWPTGGRSVERAVDLTAEMAGLWARLGPAAGAGPGRVIQFVAARSGEGVSTVAREFARVAAARSSRPAWLVDTDFGDQSQLMAVSEQPDRFGRPGPHAVGTPDGSTFFEVQPPLQDRDGWPVPDARLLVARPFLGTRLWVTRLRREGLGTGRRLRLSTSPSYWKAMRDVADFVVVDSPAFDRDDTAVRLAPLVDLTILVVAAEYAGAGEPAALKAALQASGGEVGGLVFNRARLDLPPIGRSRDVA